MATTKRTAQIQIVVEDKSIRGLNDEIKALEREMQALKVGTQEWLRANERLGDLKRDFNDAKTAAMGLQGQIKEIGTPQQIKAITELGKGMVGAFAGANAAMNLLGMESEDNFAKMTAQATQFLVVMKGLDDIQKVFRKGTLDGLRAVGQGFKKLVVVVKGASLAMKSALIATGIGALVVGVGLLITNWERFTNLISRTSKKTTKEYEQQYQYVQDIARLSEEKYKTQKELNKLTEISSTIGRDDEILSQLKNETAELDAQNKLIVARMQEERFLGNLLKEERKNLRKPIFRENPRFRELHFESELNRQRQDRLKHELEINKILQERNNDMKQVSIMLDGNNVTIRQREDLLKRLNQESNRERDIYEIQLEILNRKLESTKAIWEITNDLNALNLIEDLEFEIKLLVRGEQLRRDQVSHEKELLENQIKINKETSLRNETYLKELTTIREQTRLLDMSSQIYEDQVRDLDNQLRLYLQLSDAKEDLINFDKIGREMFYEQNQVLLEQLGITEEQLGTLEAELIIFTNLKEAEQDRAIQQKEVLLSRQEESRILQALVNDEKEALQLQSESLQAQKEALETKLNSAANDEERVEVLAKILDVETQLQGISENILNNKEELSNINTDILAIDYQIDDVNASIAASVDEINEKQKEINDTLEQQARIYFKLQEFVGKYGEEINAVQDLFMNTAMLADSIIQRQLADVDKRIADAQKKLEDLEQKERDRQTRLVGYERELSDAGGERFDELLRLMDAEQRQAEQAALEKQQAEAELLKQEQERLKMERKQAKWRKAQAITDGIIQTILATIQSLPNLLLSGIVATAGAVGVAAIASQPLPKAEKGMLVGSKHSQGGIDIEAEDGEFIMNAKAVQRYYPIIQHMNDNGRKMMATGGMVNETSTPAMSNGSGDLIDYDLLSQKIAEAVSHLPNPQVSVLKIQSELNNVKVTKSGAGLRR